MHAAMFVTISRVIPFKVSQFEPLLVRAVASKPSLTSQPNSKFDKVRLFCERMTMFASIRPLRYLWKALTAENSPRQIAWGFALGILVGLIPKGNLTAWLFGCLLLATRVNLGVGMLTAMTVTALSPTIDPLTHALGLRLLSLDAAKSLLMRWHDAPFVPWLRLNNTVVLGSTTLGLILLYPAKHIAETSASSILPRLARILARQPKADAADNGDEPAIPASEKAAPELSSSPASKAHSDAARPI